MRTYRLVVLLFSVSTPSLTASCAGSGEGPHVKVILADPTPSAECAMRCRGVGDAIAGCRTVTLPAGTDPNPDRCTHPSVTIDAACYTPRLVCQTSSTRVICGDDSKMHSVTSPEPVYVECEFIESIE